MNLQSLKWRWRRRLEGLNTRKRYIFSRITGKPVVHLIHVGKSGGIAMKHALHDHLGAGKYSLFLHGHALTLRKIPPGEKAFFFLRHPISKFVSGFYYRQRQAQPHFFVPWDDEEAIAFSHFAEANRLANALSSEDSDVRVHAVHAMRSIHQIRDSVFRWFENEEYFLSRLNDVLFIGFQEQLDSDFEVLKGILCLPEAVRLPSEEESAYQKTRSVDKHLDQTAVENLKEWYARDIRFYELCRELRERAGSGAMNCHPK